MCGLGAELAISPGFDFHKCILIYSGVIFASANVYSIMWIFLWLLINYSILKTRKHTDQVFGKTIYLLLLIFPSTSYFLKKIIYIKKKLLSSAARVLVAGNTH